MNEFEKYPELTECLQEYAAYGKFNSWSGFIASLNKALTRETPHESQPDPAIIDQELAEEADKLYPFISDERAPLTNAIRRAQQTAYVEGRRKSIARERDLEAEIAYLKKRNSGEYITNRGADDSD